MLDAAHSIAHQASSGIKSVSNALVQVWHKAADSVGSSKPRALSQLTNVNLDSDTDITKEFVSVDTANEDSIGDKPWAIGLIGGLSVLGCCFFS